MANTLSGTKGQPVVTKSPPTTVADMNSISNYAAKFGNLITDTAAARSIFASPWLGLVWNETDTGLSYRYVGSGWTPVGPFSARAVRRQVANLNSYPTVSTPTALPNGTDKAAADVSFVKRYGSTRLIVHMDASWVCTSLPTEQPMFALININSVNTTVFAMWMNLTGVRYSAGGIIELTGIAAGTYTVGPRFQSGGTADFEFAAGRDFVAFSVTESV